MLDVNSSTIHLAIYKRHFPFSFLFAPRAFEIKRKPNQSARYSSLPHFRTSQYFTLPISEKQNRNHPLSMSEAPYLPTYLSV